MKRLPLACCLLPIITASQADTTLSVHCPLGCPESPEANIPYYGHIYALSLNPATKFADWVAYEVNITNFGVSPGRDWKNNPVFSSDSILEEKDYKGASSSDLEADRGHQAPLASFAGNPYWYEANYLSNITPQDKDLNQGPWRLLEDAVRNAVDFRKSLWVVTGTIYTENAKQLPNADKANRVPSAYYKVIYDLKGNAAAFEMPQTIGRKDEYCDFSIPVSTLPVSVPEITDSAEMLSRLDCNN
jgi:endonuclease G